MAPLRFLLVATFCLALLTALSGCKHKDQESSDSAGEHSAPNKPAPGGTAVAGQRDLAALFDSLKVGMAEDEAIRLAGPPAQQLADKTGGGSSNKLIWLETGNQLYATFRDGKLEHKGLITHGGLSANTDVAKNFARVAPGMTVEDLNKLLGPPTATIRTDAGTVQRYEAAAKTYLVSFVDGKVESAVGPPGP